MSATAVIVAAGSGVRAGFDKVMADLGGRPVLLHSIEAFARTPGIGDIVVVTNPEREAVIRRLAAPQVAGRLRFVPGGAERHLSVWNGIQAATGSLVAVHDGARPLIRPAQIARCLARAAETGAAASARRVSETLMRAHADGTVLEPVDRTGLWLMETPQVFARTALVASYEKILRDGVAVTDEVSALHASGMCVWLVENETPNLKITWPGDLSHAQRLLE